MESNRFRHKVYLVVDSFKPDVIIIRKDYFHRGGHGPNFYHYNAVHLNMQLSNSDKNAYPAIHEAVKRCSGSKQPTFNIEFNRPKESWNRPPSNGNICGPKVRVTVDARKLLKEIYVECGYNLKVCIRGHVSRYTLSRGRPYALNGRWGEDIELRVNPDGTTEEKVITMVRGLFGLFQLNALLTVSLEWEGPGPYLGGCVSLTKKLTPNFEILARNKKSYSCNSEVLSEVSPVFEAMLKSGMKESESKRIRIDDFDGNLIEVFLEYVHERSIQPAFRSAGVCFQLFSFANKYQITELEHATRLLLLNKDEEWFATENALDLYCLSSQLQDEDLVERALSIIKKRKKALHQMEEFQELPSDVKAILMK